MLTAEPKAYGSSFFVATQADSPARARLNFEVDADVGVIGAGLAGLTAAREIARRGWSVVVLEAQSVAWNASGRNAGVVRPGFAADPAALVERVGLTDAKALWALSAAGVEYVREAAQDRAMAGVALSESGWLHVSKADNRRAMDAAIDLLAGEFGVKIERWPAEWVRQVLNSPLYFDALHYPHAFSLHPLNYALGLAALAEQAGARIFQDTPAIEIDPAGVRKRIGTRDSKVRAAHVVLAGNVHIAGLMPQFASTLTPVYSAAITTSPLGEALAEAIRFPGAVSDNATADNSYRVIDGGRLLWSGRSSVWRGRPKAYGSALIRDIRRTYPQLRDVKVEHAWTAAIGQTVHGMPQIGEVSSGLWLLSGFGDHGLNTSAIGGELVARAIVDNDHTWRLFSNFELVWAGGRAGRAARQISFWTERVRDRFISLVARRRQAKSRRAAAAAAAAEPAPSETISPSS
jgi:glycine/D-amino acid oxidase-like deaminating enzyme